jgi:hypothetical protein
MARPLPPAESDTLKEEYLKAYIKNGGYSYAACKTLSIPYQTFHYWCNHDEAFSEQIKFHKELMLDRAEAELFDRAINIRERDTPLIFFLKSKGRERGYIDRVETVNKDEYIPNDADKDLKERMTALIIADYEEKKNVEG